MRLDRTFGHPLLGAAMLLLGAATAAGQEYAIHLDRPSKVGQTYTISAVTQFKMENTLGAPGIQPRRQQEAFTVELDGTVEVLAVDQKSREPTKVSCTVSKCVRDEQPLLAEGTVLVAYSGPDDTRYMVNDQPVQQPIAASLHEVLGTHRPGAPGDDAVFGTDQPKKVADTWPLHPQGAAKLFSHEGVDVSQDRITGSAKLTGVRETDGRKLLEIETESSITDLHGVLPDGMAVIGGNASFHYTGLVPADGEGMSPGGTSQMKFSMKLEGEDLHNRPFYNNVSVERTAKVEYKELKN